MSANKYQGKVFLKMTGGISKSAHEAVFLQTEEGNFELRIRGVNPFQKSPFLEWVGKEVIVEGKQKENLIFVETILDCADQ